MDSHLEGARKLEPDVLAAEEAGEAAPGLPATGESLEQEIAARHAAGDYDGAIEAYRTLLASDPGRFEVQHDLAVSLELARRYMEALEAYGLAIKMRPGEHGAYEGMARCHVAVGQPDKAVACLRHVLRSHPDSACAWETLGRSMYEMCRFEEAAAAWQRCILIRPEDLSAYIGMSASLRLDGRLEEAQEACKFALDLDPPPGVRGALLQSLWETLLVAGDRAAGWAVYEDWASERDLICGLPPHAAPVWDGGAIPGRTLLVSCEWGVSEALMLLRLLPEAKRRSQARIALVCPPELARLAESCEGVDRCIVADRGRAPADEPADARIELTRLCARLSFWPGAAAAPYLGWPDGESDLWTPEHAGRSGFKVGVAWSAETRLRWKGSRSCRISDLAPLAAVRGLALFSLQRGEPARELDSAPEEIRIVDLGAGSADLAEVAQVIRHLDLVIGVDTDVLHLAGALGARAFALLPSAGPDWRWPREGERTDWYPDMQIFRQRSPWDWGPAVEQAASALRRLADEKSAAR